MVTTRITFWFGLLTLVAVGQVHGQTPGEGKKIAVKDSAAAAVVPAKPAPVKPAHEAVAEILTKLGFEPKIVTPDIGSAYNVVQLKDKDGNKYVIEMKIQKGIWLIATLDQVPQGKIDTEKLMRLLEANEAIAPCFFVYRASDRRLCLKLEVVQATDQALLGDFQVLVNAVRLTDSLWSTANWTKEARSK